MTSPRSDSKSARGDVRVKGRALVLSLETLVASDVWRLPSLWESARTFKSLAWPMVLDALLLAGGDGLDAWLSAVALPPSHPSDDVLLVEIYVCLSRMREAVSHAEQVERAAGLPRSISEAFQFPRPLSRKRYRLLPAKLPEALLFGIVLADDNELRARQKAFGKPKRKSNSAPDALSTERALVEAELRRRSIVE